MKRVKIVVGVLFTLVMLSSLINKYAVQPRINKSKQLLRLHVVANSNSLTDQQLKREVRQALLKAGQELFVEVTNISQARQKIISNFDYLEKAAQEKVYQAGKNYKVKLQLGEFNFPRRSYGNLTLPSGSYQSLNVILGSGQGENWWCVLFPPLCFVDTEDKISAEEFKKELKNDKEINRIPVKFKLKLAEYIKDNPELVKFKAKLGKILFNQPH